MNKPWWKEPYVWLVIAGPVSAVVACAITAIYIYQGPDAVVPEHSYPQGLKIKNETQVAQPPMQPAIVFRNHSQTGGKRNEK
jgi:uncharacterized protein